MIIVKTASPMAASEIADIRMVKNNNDNNRNNNINGDNNTCILHQQRLLGL